MAIKDGTDDLKTTIATWGEIIRGSRGALIRAGVVSGSWKLPGDAGRRRGTRYRDNNGRELRIYKRGECFEVWRDFEEEEMARREAAEAQRRARECQRLPDVPVGYATRLLAGLARRYPRLCIESASAGKSHGWLVQTVTFKGRLEDLIEYGLVTEKMVEWETGRHNPYAVTPIGDHYTLSPDHEDKLGRWIFHVYTGSDPRERPRFSLEDAMKVLRQFRVRPQRITKAR